MIRFLGISLMVVSLTAIARAGIDPGNCSLAGSTLQFCDPSGQACTTSTGEAGSCTQRREGCECVPKKTSVCHRNQGARPYVQIEVSNRALLAHLKHGDCLVDDGNSCTRDACDPQLGCVHSTDDSACDDGRFCNGTETCDAARGCQPGTAPECADDVDCTVDSCDDETDSCAHVPDHDACNDENDCTTDACNPTVGCTHDLQCQTDTDCATDICIIASCTEDGCCVAIDRCPPTTGTCRNVTGACDEDGDCVEENLPDGTPCDSGTGSTLCGENGCDAACHDGVCPSICPEGSVQLSNSTCGIPCATSSDCDGTGCGPHLCGQTADGSLVCLSASAFFQTCVVNTDCPTGQACFSNRCADVCPPR